MTVLQYKIVRHRSIKDVESDVNSLLATHQPHGELIVDHDNRLFCQPMVATGGAVVTDGMELTGVEPTGTYTDTVTFAVADGKVTGITLS
ncbi:MAG: hypothetical protein RBT67_02710 [Thauera sp.]|jgi:hypothetical protein|nr:hypothetical protein [Thauera sp.]